jgi:hypothetical protein
VRPYLKKQAGGVAQGVGPEFKPQYCKKTNYKKNFNTVGKNQKTVHMEYTKKTTILDWE